jgi:hypothetical protein
MPQALTNFLALLQLAGLGQNRVYGAFYSDKTAHKPVKTSSEKQTTG